MEYRMNRILEFTRAFFEIPLDLRSRFVIVLSALVTLPTFFLPLWQMTLYSNQFPEGLELDIYSYKLEGAKSQNRDDLKEINALNHYIGMRPLVDDDFTEFKWIPFVIGATALLALRSLVLGKMDKLVDLFVLFTYFGLFSLWSFYHKLYLYGHNLDPTAAVKVPPFTPPLFGHRTMANFEVYNYPSAGSYFMAAVPVLLLLAMWLSYRSWKKASGPAMLSMPQGAA
jgi:copper chaperone NosL